MKGDDDKRNQILDGAGRAFGRYGFRKTTLADIVREAGVARATVYNYFGSKEEVFRGVIEREVADIVATVREAVGKETTTRGRLRAAVTTHTAALKEKVNVFRLTIEALPDVLSRVHEDMENIAQEALRLYSGILREGVEAGEIEVEDIETTAWSIILAFKGVFMTTVTGQMPEHIPGVVDTLLDVMWNGLSPREEIA